MADLKIGLKPGTDLKRGLKAGVSSGLIAGLLSGVIAAILIFTMFQGGGGNYNFPHNDGTQNYSRGGPGGGQGGGVPGGGGGRGGGGFGRGGGGGFGLINIIPNNGAGVDPGQIRMFMAITGIITGLAAGLLLGIIFGLIFAALYDKIPGKTVIGKGLVVGLAYFAIVIIFPILMALIFPGPGGMRFGRGLSVEIGYITSLITALVFGYLLAWFWNKFEPKINSQKQ